MEMVISKRIIGLDYFRILLAILIFLFHSHIHMGCDYGLFNAFVSVGAIAMTGFMLLSGFVLYYTYSHKNLMHINEMKNFYLKRIIAVIPLYYCISLIHVSLQYLCGEISWKDLLILFPVDVLAIQNSFFSLSGFSHHSGTWFISCLMMCYLLYPFLQSTTIQLSYKKRFSLFVILCLILLYAPIVQIWFHLKMVTVYANPFYRMIEFCIGILLGQEFLKQQNKSHYTRYSFFKSPFALLLFIIILIVSVSVIKSMTKSNNFMIYNWVALPCFIILIYNFAILKQRRQEYANIIMYFGNLSLSFYLCQVFPIWKLSSSMCLLLGTTSNLYRSVVSFVICIIMALMIHEILEKPISRFLKNKWIPSKMELISNEKK